MNILIVEDEIKIRNGLNRLLSGYENHQVVGKAKNGKEGLELVQQLHPDLIFTDIQMPEMDGLEMLEQLKDTGETCHSVILTGYAEFEYAKRALSCGADDYLLKPITVEAVEKVLDGISEKIAKEATKIEADPRAYLKAILSGALELTPEVLKKANLVLGIAGAQSLCLARGHVASGTYHGQQLEEQMKNHRGFYVSEDGKEAYVLFAIEGNGYASVNEIKSMLERRLGILNPEEFGIWTLQECEGLQDIKAANDVAERNLLYGMSLHQQRVLTETVIRETAMTEYPYSHDMEKAVEKILVQQDGKQWECWITNVVDSLKKEVYDPISVQQAFRNLASFILQISSKLWPEKGRKLRELDTVMHMGNAKMLSEFVDLLNQQIAVILSDDQRRDDIHNYTILKAITYIREHYAEKISQEDVAEYLEITPEYLSTLFHREINKNFATFINEFRISSAKRMLKSSDLKIYEIAEKVGFTDTKYFNRVFKEIEGISPKEYRGQ